MFYVPTLLLAVVLAGWSLVAPQRAAWAFVAFLALLEGWLLLVEWARRPAALQLGEDPRHFTPDEVVVLRSYPLFFQFPVVSVQLSRALHAIQLLSVVVFGWLLFKSQWVQAGLVAFNFLVLGPLSLRLNPIPFLERSATSGKAMAQQHLAVIDPLFQRLYPTGNTKPDA